MYADTLSKAEARAKGTPSGQHAVESSVQGGADNEGELHENFKLYLSLLCHTLHPQVLLWLPMLVSSPTGSCSTDNLANESYCVPKRVGVLLIKPLSAVILARNGINDS